MLNFLNKDLFIAENRISKNGKLNISTYSTLSLDRNARDKNNREPNLFNIQVFAEITEEGTTDDTPCNIITTSEENMTGKRPIIKTSVSKYKGNSEKYPDKDIIAMAIPYNGTPLVSDFTEGHTIDGFVIPRSSKYDIHKGIFIKPYEKITDDVFTYNNILYLVIEMKEEATDNDPVYIEFDTFYRDEIYRYSVVINSSEIEISVSTVTYEEDDKVVFMNSKDGKYSFFSAKKPFAKKPRDNRSDRGFRK